MFSRFTKGRSASKNNNSQKDNMSEGSLETSKIEPHRADEGVVAVSAQQTVDASDTANNKLAASSGAR